MRCASGFVVSLERQVLRTGQEGTQQTRSRQRILLRIIDHQRAREGRAYLRSPISHPDWQHSDETVNDSIGGDTDARGELRVAPGMFEKQVPQVGFERGQIAFLAVAKDALEQCGDNRKIVRPAFSNPCITPEGDAHQFLPLGAKPMLATKTGFRTSFFNKPS